MAKRSIRKLYESNPTTDVNSDDASDSTDRPSTPRPTRRRLDSPDVESTEAKQAKSSTVDADASANTVETDADNGKEKGAKELETMFVHSFLLLIFY